MQPAQDGVYLPPPPVSVSLVAVETQSDEQKRDALVDQVLADPPVM